MTSFIQKGKGGCVMTRRIAIGALCMMLGFSIGALAVRVLPASHDLEQQPGTVESYTLTVLNDTNSPEELTLYVGDWQRFEDGEYDYGLPLNTARWILDRPFTAGEILELVYSIQVPLIGDLGIEGSFKALTPEWSDITAGATVIHPDSIGETPIATNVPAVWVGRTIDSISAGGLAVVRLSIQCNADFNGLVIYETTAERVDFASIDGGDARFDTVNRSNAAWITLSHDRLILQPDESRDVAVTVAMPEGVTGTYWSMVFVVSQPQATDQGGMRVLSIYRTAIKIYSTALGSDVLSGQVVDVQVGETSPLILYALFENTGNVELVVTGDAQIIDRTGEVVRNLAVGEFKVLPGAKRIVTILDSADADPLPAEIYQAVVSFDYGGDNPVVGVRGFRIR
jgi:hypothetical protein